MKSVGGPLSCAAHWFLLQRQNPLDLSVERVAANHDDSACIVPSAFLRVPSHLFMPRLCSLGGAKPKPDL